MSFPDPVELPDSIKKARDDRRFDVIRVTILGIAIRFLIICTELVAYYYYGSAVLLLDALATSADIISSLILVVSLYFATKPPDSNHPFGHGRLEPIVGLQLSLVLIVLGGMLGWHQLFEAQDIGPPLSPYLWLVPSLAVIFLFFTFRMMMKIAVKRKSEALKAEAEHYRVDCATTLLAIVVLLAGAFYPETSHYLDHIGAVFIALIMILLGFRAAKGNFAQLMDKKPDPKYFKIVKNAAKSVAGVLGTEKVRIQLYGPDAHVDIDIEVDPKQAVEDAHKISQLVRAEIQKKIPEVLDVTVHIEPFYPGDH